MKIEDFEESEPTERIPLRVRFESMEEVESAYRTDISRGGFFVETSEPPPLRAFVEVEFCVDEWPDGLRLEGEVVRREVDGTSEEGVAVAFSLPMPELRLAFRSRMESVTPAASPRLSLESLFRVDPDRRAHPSAVGDPLEASLIDLAGSGSSLARMLEVIPESEERIRNRLAALLKAHVISRLE